MKFKEFMELVDQMYELTASAEYIRDSWDDYGASPGCECGCGGDTFDWGGQSEAFSEAREYEREAAEIYEKLQNIWEER